MPYLKKIPWSAAISVCAVILSDCTSEVRSMLETETSRLHLGAEMNDNGDSKCGILLTESMQNQCTSMGLGP